MSAREESKENIVPSEETVSSVVGRFLSGNVAKSLHRPPSGRVCGDSKFSEPFAVPSSAFGRSTRPAVAAMKPRTVNIQKSAAEPLVFDRGNAFLRDSRRRTAQKLSKKRDAVHNTSIDEDLENRRTVQFTHAAASSTNGAARVLSEYKSLFYRKSVRLTKRVVVHDEQNCESDRNSRDSQCGSKLRPGSSVNLAQIPRTSCLTTMNEQQYAVKQHDHESQFVWRRSESELPVNKNDLVLYQCVVLYTGCSTVSTQRMYSIVLDKTIKHLRDNEAWTQTVLLQIYHNFTIVRDSSNKVRLVLPNDCISLCVASPTMPMYMGVIMSPRSGGRECIVFGTDRSLLSHGSREHQKYVNRFGLTCVATTFDGVSSCTAFPSSPVRLMHHLTFAKTLLTARCKGWNAKNIASSDERTSDKNNTLPGKVGLDPSVIDIPKGSKCRGTALLQEPASAICLRNAAPSSLATSHAECSAAITVDTKSSGVPNMATNGSTDSKSNDIEKLLKNETYRRPFQSFLEQQFCAENLNFYMAVEDYRQIPDSERDRRIAFARQIYERHFTANSVEPVNIDNSTNKGIRDAVVNGRFTADLYDVAQYQIFHLLKYDCWPRYIRAGGVAPPSNDDPEKAGTVNRTASIRQQQSEATKKKFCTLMCNETFNSEQIPLTDPRESVGKWTATMAEQRGYERNGSEVVDAQTGSTIDPARQAVDALNNRSVRLVPIVYFPVEIIAPSASPKSSLSQATLRIVLLRVRQNLSAGSVLRPLMIKYSIDSEQSVVCFTGTTDPVPMSFGVGKIPPRSLTIMTSQQFQDRSMSNKREPQRDLSGLLELTNDSNLPFHQHGDIAFCEVPLDLDVRLTKLSATRSYSNNPKTDHTSGLMKFMRKASHAVTNKDSDSTTGTSLSHQSSIVVERQKNDNFRRKSFGSTFVATATVVDAPYCGDNSTSDPKPAKVAASGARVSSDSANNKTSSENNPTTVRSEPQQVSATPSTNVNGAAPKVPILYTSAIRSDRETLTPTDTNSERSIGWQTADYV